LIEAPVTRVGIVGPGKVGRTLALALERGGLDVVAVVGRADDPSGLAAAQAVILTVPDDAIGQAYARLSGSGALARPHVALHCSGLVTAGVLSGGAGQAGRAAMHPMLAFADVEQALRMLPGTTFGVEGDETGEAAASRLVQVMGGRVVTVPPEARPSYHLACVMASNGLVALTDMAEQIMRTGGVTGAGLGEGLAHLVQGTADNMARLGVRPAMTGPVVRGDARTVRGHLSILEGASPDVARTYRVLMRRLVDMAVQSGRGDPSLYAPILDEIGDETT